MRARFWVKILPILMIPVLAACSAGTPKPVATGTSTPEKQPETAQTSQPAQPTKLVLATATKGGVFLVLGQEMAALWNEAVPNVNVTAIETGGTKENIQKLGFKEADLAMAVSGITYYAVSGTGEYAAQGKQPGMRGMLALHPNIVHLLVNESANISSVAGLKGLAWAPGARGSATETNTREILGTFNLNPDTDLKNFYQGYDETVANMKAGKVQGATLAAGIGGKAVKDALALGGWKLLSMTKEQVAAIVAKYPAYFQVTIPANTYPGQKDAVVTVAQGSILLVREDIPDDVVYQLTKSFYEYLPKLAVKVSAAADIKREQGLRGITGVIPLHPGATKYFRELGIGN